MAGVFEAAARSFSLKRSGTMSNFRRIKGTFFILFCWGSRRNADSQYASKHRGLLNQYFPKVEVIDRGTSFSHQLMVIYPSFSVAGGQCSRLTKKEISSVIFG